VEIGDAVKLHSCDYLGIGIITAFYSNLTVYVYFPNWDDDGKGLVLWRERLEVL